MSLAKCSETATRGERHSSCKLTATGITKVLMSSQTMITHFMRHQKIYQTFRLAIVFFLLSFFNRATAQVQTIHPNTPMGTYVPGFYDYLPVGYASSTQTYPLLIFIHGMGEIGDGSPASMAPI